jgi:hypothetical protein
MRRVSSLMKGYHALRVSFFLIVVVLVVGAAACDGVGGRTYELTISSTSGGLVATPGEGTYPYGAGIVVQLVATPNEGYEFHSWTGDVESIGDPNAASTSITVNGGCAIVANFQAESEPGSDEEPIVPPAS